MYEMEVSANSSWLNLHFLSAYETDTC